MSIGATPPVRIVEEEFGAALLSEVQSLDCGDEPWATEISEWIKLDQASGKGALYSMSLPDDAKFKSTTWLYWHPDGELIGYGSLGLARWRDVPTPGTPYVNLSIIPYFGIAKHFRGEPKSGEKAHRFSRQIMDDLLSKACRQGTQDIALFVDSKNVAAQKFYADYHFTPLSSKTLGLIRMHRPLFPRGEHLSGAGV